MRYSRIFACCVGILLILTNCSIYAESLLEVYRHALVNDPQFKQAQANLYAAQENLPIARAALLPLLNLQANVAYNNQNYTQDAAFAENGDYTSTALYLNLNQPILNYGLWKSLESAHASVKSATATYCYAQQDLIVRTVKAYLSVLQANDILKYTRASKAAFAEEYDNAKQKHDVGLASVTDVYDAQARYDHAVAQEINNINSLENNLEALHEITNHYYQVLNGLSEKGIPLSTPIPDNIDLWAQKAAAQNYRLQSQHFNVESAKANIGVQAANNLPTLELQGTFSDQRQYDRTLLITNKNEDLVYQLSTIALGVNWDIFSGGSVIAETRQARYQYAASSAEEETIYRQVVSATRQAFLGVILTARKYRLMFPQLDHPKAPWHRPKPAIRLALEHYWMFWTTPLSCIKINKPMP